MKKLILRFGTRIVAFNMRTIGIVILSLSPIFLGILCGRINEDRHHGSWLVKNCTNQTLILDYSLENVRSSIAPGNSILIGTEIFPYDDKILPYFDRLIRIYINTGVKDMSFKVLSKDSVLLRTWSYSDRDLPGKQFFKESSWRYNERKKKDLILATWVFDIRPEDIIKKDD